jgi:hypothetical protein
MLALLRLEDVNRKQRAFVKEAMRPGKLARLCARTCRAPWVADISDGARSFIEGFWDYSCGTGRHGKVMVVFFLPSGRRYEVSDPANKRRYFCRVADGVLEEE